jgi:hypothetical protein
MKSQNALIVELRDIQRLSTTRFSSELRKEYFDCPQKDSHVVRYITFNRVGRGESVLLLCSLATVTYGTYCMEPSVRIVTKSL